MATGEGDAMKDIIYGKAILLANPNVPWHKVQHRRVLVGNTHVPTCILVGCSIDLSLVQLRKQASDTAEDLDE